MRLYEISNITSITSILLHIKSMNLHTRYHRKQAQSWRALQKLDLCMLVASEGWDQQCHEECEGDPIQMIKSPIKTFKFVLSFKLPS